MEKTDPPVLTLKATSALPRISDHNQKNPQTPRD
jgi:hypothetical protein